MSRLRPGLWSGIYRYDPRALEVPFEMSVRATSGRGFDGWIRSDQFPETGAVSGTRRLLSSHFTVRYPRLRVVAEDGSLMGLRELILEQFQVEPANDLPHPLIHYRTTRSLDRSNVRGSWEMPESSVVDETSGWRIDFPTCTGTWWARRIGDPLDADDSGRSPSAGSSPATQRPDH